MSRRAVVAFVFCFLIALTQLHGAGQPYSLITVESLTKPQYQSLLGLGLDIARVDGDRLEIVATPTDLHDLEQAGIPYELMIEDMTAFYQARLPKARDMGGYMTLSEVNDAGN